MRAEAAPVVTIVIIAYNARDDLQRGLESIAEHAGMPVQTIVIDNASADDSVDFVRESHPEVELITLARNLADAARDYGLRIARGRYVMFLDSDAALTAGALPAMVAAMDTHPDWGLIGPRLVGDDGSLQLSCRRFPPLILPPLRRPPLARFFDDSALVRHHLMAEWDHATARPVVYVIGACQLFRADLARRAGAFDAEGDFYVAADIDWCIRIRDAGGQIVYYPDATVIHSYQRRTRRNPVSKAALRHLKAFYALQWHYRHRRRELIRLGEQPDPALPEGGRHLAAA